MVRALPRQIHDHPSEEQGDEARYGRVIARAERGVEEDGRRGASVRPALAVPREIIDEATGEMLDVVQNDDPDLPLEPDRQEPADPT